MPVTARARPPRNGPTSLHLIPLSAFSSSVCARRDAQQMAPRPTTRKHTTLTTDLFRPCIAFLPEEFGPTTGFFHAPTFMDVHEGPRVSSPHVGSRRPSDGQCALTYITE